MSDAVRGFGHKKKGAMETASKKTAELLARLAWLGLAGSMA